MLPFQKNILTDLEQEVKKYKHTYFCSQLNLGRQYIIDEYIKNLPKNSIIYYFANCSSNFGVEYFEEKLKQDIGNKFNITSVLRPVDEGTICVFCANEHTIDKKIKNLNPNANIILINDTNFTTKPMSITKIIDAINPSKIITVTYPEKLTQAERFDMLIKKVGYVYATINGAIKDEFYIKGFLSLTTAEYQKFQTNLNVEENLLMCGVNKLKQLQSFMDKVDEINLCNLILVENKEAINKVKEFLLSNKIPENEICATMLSSFSKRNKILNFDSPIKYLIFTKPELIDNFSRASVLTMLKKTCKAGVLYELINNLSLTLEKQHYYIDELNFKHLYTYDSVKDIKESLKPAYTKSQPIEKVINTYRKDIEPFTLICECLKKGELPSLNIDSYMKNYIENFLTNMFGKLSKSKLQFLGFSFDKSEQSIMIDSFIKTYNDYNINQKKIVDDIEKENYDNCKKAIKSALSCQEILINKIDGKNSADVLMPILVSWFTSHFKLKNNDVYKMIINDLNNHSSIFKYIFDYICSTYEKYTQSSSNLNYRRKEFTKIMTIPFESEEIKKTEIIPANKCGMLYATTPKQQNEKWFLEYLEENENVDWWIKNGDSGQDYFSITYYIEDEPYSFYPDWIIMLKNKKLLIADTKDGNTLNDSGLTYAKIEALKEYCKNKEIFYGIITQVSGVWRISRPDTEYYTDKNFTNFIYLDEYLNQITKER